MKLFKVLLYLTLTQFFLFIVCFELCRFEYIGTRPHVALVNPQIKDEVRTATEGMNEQQIIQFCNHYVSDTLSFAIKPDTRTANNIRTTAHCVGYASVYTSICNYAFQINRHSAKCKHAYGYVTLLGIQLNTYLEWLFGPFLKDHDYVIIKSTAGSYVVDPSLSDLVYPKVYRLN